MVLTTRSFFPSRRGSLRVATTVPTTRARSISETPTPAAQWPGHRAQRERVSRLAADQLGGLAEGQHVFQRRVRPRNDVHGDQLAPAARGGGAGGRGRVPPR